MAAYKKAISVTQPGKFQHTATRRWLPPRSISGGYAKTVSTHSHPKVAATGSRFDMWIEPKFQHTATRRWLRLITEQEREMIEVSTHSHPKVAAFQLFAIAKYCDVSTHSHPKVAAQEIFGVAV